MIEKTVENTPTTVDDPCAVALIVENDPCIIEKEI